MSKCVRSARVRRVSSQATRSTSRRTRSARRVMSSRLPIGVATTKSVPLRLRRLLLRFRDEEGPLAVQDDLARDDALLERSEEHTSELQSQSNLVCRLLLEKKKQTIKPRANMTNASS